MRRSAVAGGVLWTDGKMERLARGIDDLNERIGRFAAWSMAGVVAIVFLVVALRYGFNWGRVWMQEAYVWLNAAGVLLGAAYTLRHDAHVRIDIYYERWSPRAKALADLLGCILLLVPVLAMILVTSRGYVWRSWAIRETSREAGGLPALYLLKTLIPVFAVLMALQGFAMAVRCLRRLRGERRA
jgi:TRAP-type mannitol/chloroaromatic compound transport system permease small subunit